MSDVFSELYGPKSPPIRIFENLHGRVIDAIVSGCWLIRFDAEQGADVCHRIYIAYPGAGSNQNI